MAKKDPEFNVEIAKLLNEVNSLDHHSQSDQVPADAVSKHGPSGNPVIVASCVPTNCVVNQRALIASGYLKIVPILNDRNPSS
jgi:hypothetical protein